jgi:hypothetical protein
MQRQQKKPQRVHVQYRDGKVGYIPWKNAYDLEKTNKAIFISNTLYKAAKAGIDITRIKGKDRSDDVAIKQRIKERLQKQEEQRKKVEKKKQKQET